MRGIRVKPPLLVVTVCLGLSGCLVGNLANDLSLKGKPLGTVEQRYGKPADKEAVQGGSRYTWNAPDGRHPCTMLVTTDPDDRVTDVKMVGRNRDCYDFRRTPAAGR